MSAANGLNFEHNLVVVQTPNKGAAVVAKRAIAQGTKITLPGVLWYIKNEVNLQVAIDYVAEYEIFCRKYPGNPQVLCDIHSLQSFRSGQTVPTQQSLHKMFQVNGWRHLNGSIVAVAVGSFFNHSCDPDFFAEIKLRNNRMYVTAERNIAEGVEVSVSYLGTTQLRDSVDNRQAALAPWEFFCECRRCKTDQQELHKKAQRGNVEAIAALRRLELLYDAAHPIVVDDDDTGPAPLAATVSPSNPQTQTAIQHSKQSLRVASDSAGHMQEGDQEQSPHAHAQGAGAAGGAPIRNLSASQQASARMRTVEQPPASVEQPPAGVEQPPAGVEQSPAGVEQSPAGVEQPPASVAGISAGNWIVAPLRHDTVSPGTTMLPPMLLVAPVVPAVWPAPAAVTAVPLRLGSRPTVHGRTAARMDSARVLARARLAAFAIDEERTRLGLQLCSCKSGNLFKHCHQFLVRIPKVAVNTPCDPLISRL